jgi:hypothetical protein
MSEIIKNVQPINESDPDEFPQFNSTLPLIRMKGHPSLIIKT